MFIFAEILKHKKMYKKSQEKSDQILSLYKEGKMLTEITQLTSSSQATVKKVLLHSGIDYDSERKKSRSETLNKVLELYNLGKSQTYIEKELNLTRKTIRELLKSKGIEYRDRSKQKFIDYGTQLDETVFDQLTPESLYWIGLLFADGHIEKNEFSVSLTLSNKDYEHLEKFKRFLKSNRKITKDHGDCSRVRVNSKKLWSRLKELGFTHNKSEVEKPHSLLKNSKDFWRGVVDGDGGVYNYEYMQQMALCGTLETIFDFAIFCNSYAGVIDKYPSPSDKKGYAKNKLFQISYYSKDCKKVLDLLYKDATVYLERKYNTYLEMTQEN
jgi:hypothetical protein